ncbi:hypothetical protein ALGA_3275 [Labilibaculum antarcticum]|uniref:Sensory/regulatory protein RpfC n=2 Tax=Labilibaculum antarcticum TaxID=1717717 RepID=A0A1Y1CMJ6_9BACT|nr:hypothetical protein ALGA_3275 [Labilibaculum antarcticum]
MVNNEMLSILGFVEDEELLSKNIADFYFEAHTREKLIAKYDISPKAQIKNKEIKFKRKDGSPIWILMTAKAIKNKDYKTESYDGFIIDITNKKEDQERLNESNNHLSAFVDASSNMIYIKDENEKYLNVNKSLCEFINKSKDEIKYKRDEEIPNNPFHLASTASPKNVLTNDTIIRKTVQIKDRIFELSNFPVTVAGKLRSGGIYSDITEQTKQEKIQHFLYEISELSFTENSLSNYLGKIHQGIKKLISANNFYIALYDSESQEYSFPYCVDACASYPENYSSELRGSLTDLVRRNKIGKIFVGKEQEQVYADSNEQVIEEPSAVWMGAPIINKETNQAIGVIAVQDYTNQKAYSDNDLKILEIITHNIGIFIRRVKYIELLKRAKEQAEESKLVYESLFNENASAMILIDAKNAKIEDANQSACNFYGYTKQEILTLFIQDLSIDPASLVTNEINKTAKCGNFSAEYKHKLANNEIRDVEVFSGKIMLHGKSFIYSIINDISTRKKNELEIQRLYSAIDQSLSPIALTDLKGVITYANPGYCYTSGYSKEELIGQSTSIHKSGETPKQIYNDLWQTILKGEIWSGEITNKKKNGELYIEQVNISPVFDENHKLLQFTKASRDITKELKIKKELIEAKENAEESDRLKSAFLANMSHEIRTPMNGILGFTSLLQDSDFTGEEKDEFINIIKQSGDRLLNTVNDLIDISMIEAGQIKISKTELNVTKQIENLCSFFKPEAGAKGIQLEFITESENNDLVMETDEAKFTSILTNLIKNAIKFSMKGTIQIECECLEGRNKGHAKFSVKDQGVGIAHDKLDRVFNRFEQEDITNSKSYDGSGIGLTIAKAYVEALGGQIWVDSEKSKGSNFQFTLPLSSMTQTKSIIDFQSQNEEQSDKNGIKILIAEDEKAISKYLSIILKDISREIILAKNGAEALEIYSNQRDIDLILMDINMPVMDGYEATRRIREFDRNIPIIAQTAFALSNDKEKILASGFDKYISKPIDKNKLINMITALKP